MDGRLIGGRYRLLEARAIGGSASVWRALDERTGRPVAVKRLHPHLAGDEHARERLRREATAMGAVEHPNVVPVRDVVVDADGPAIIMDYIEGRSLAERLADDGTITEPEALRIATEVADGLAAAHGHGLVHRDVKPANILLGADGRARITDFGIAAEIDDVSTALTAQDGVVGTLRYLAPERLAGEPAVPATDVWGLGAVLYEMLAGAVPYPATTVLERAESALQVPVRPTGLGAATWAVIERALASDPRDRYPEAGAMATDLRLTVPRASLTVDPWADTMVVPIAPAATVAGIDGLATDEGVVGRGPDMSGLKPGPVVGRAPQRRGRGAGLAVVGALALILVIGLAAINAGSAGNDQRGTGATESIDPSLEAPVASPSTAPTTSPTTAPVPGKPDDSGRGKGGDKGKGGD